MPPLTDEKKNEINSTLDQVRARYLELGGDINAVDASKLTEPVKRVKVPTPATATIPLRASQIVSNITRDVNGYITAQTDEAKQLKDLQTTYGDLNNEGSLSSLYNRTLEGAGVNGDTFKELKDISLQLTDMNTGSEMTKTKIAGAEGQTLAQGQREVTQEDRENAVRSAGLAARAAVLQGNIETARAAASEAVNIAFQDRQLKSQNLIKQIEMVQGSVDEQTAQLLEQEKRQYEIDLADIAQLKEDITTAVATGGATQQEISTLTSTSVDDATKRTLAAQIISRAAAAKSAASGKSTGSSSIGNMPSFVNLDELGGENDPMVDIIEASAGGRVLTQSEVEPMTNANRVLNQLGDLSTMIETQTGPIMGIIRSKNPYDVKAQEIGAAITAIVPQLARGIYGEVGVLTDEDVARYVRTLPNVQSTADVNKAIMGLTLRNIRSAFVSNLEAMAAAGRDVSGFKSIYQRMNTQISTIESELGIGVEGVSTEDLDAEYDALSSGKGGGGIWQSIKGFLIGTN